MIESQNNVRSNTLFDMPSPKEEYKQLVGHNRTDGSFKTDEQIRSEYVQLTDKVIHEITQGVRVQNPTTKEVVFEPYDFVIWLDKSARPVAWLTQELWPVLAPDITEDGVRSAEPEIPAFRFVNIDREQWVNQVDPNGTGLMDVDSINQSIIRSLRSIFISPKDKREGLTGEIDRTPAELDGKNVLIIDEVYSSGRTLDIAKKFFARAFPTARIEGSYWMRGVTNIASAVGNADLPVWYDDKRERGRGVGNRDDRVSQRSNSLTQRLGALFLSTRQNYSDIDAKQLRSEFKKLRQDVMDKKVFVIPDTEREPEDFSQRAIALNGLNSFAEFLEKKKEQDSKK